MFAAILPLLGGLWSKFSLYIVIVVIVALAMVGIKIHLTNHGRLLQKKEDLERGVKGIKKRHEIEREMRRVPDAELDKWL